MIIRISQFKNTLLSINVILGISLSLLLNGGIGQDPIQVYAQTKLAPLDAPHTEIIPTNSDSISDNTVFYTESTRSNNMRVINIDPVPRVEVSYSGNSTINGSSVQTFGTIIDTMNEYGSVYSEGKAIILTSTGRIITYISESIGHYNPDGSFYDSGMIFFKSPFHNWNNIEMQTKNNTESESMLEFNNTLGMYKKTVDPSGNGLMKVWKWS